MDFNQMLSRVIRFAKLDLLAYEEAEADTTLNREALTVVVIVSALSALGVLIGGLFTGIGPAILFAAWTVLWGIVGYYIWTYITFFVGTKLFGGVGDVGELLRTLGYSQGPRALGVLAFIPCVGGLAGLVGSLWALVCGVVAIRQTLDFTTGKAIVTVVIGWIVITVIGLFIAGILGAGALGLGALTGNLQ